MKPFLLFEGLIYYNEGGWNDFAGGFDTLEEAIASVSGRREFWWHVVDSRTGRIVEEGTGGESAV